MTRSLTRIGWLSTAFAGLAVLLAAFAGYSMLADHRSIEDRARAALVTDGIAEQTAAMFEQHRRMLAQIATQPEIVQLFANGRQRERAEQSLALQKLFPYARRVLLLPAGIDNDIRAIAALSQECIDLIRKAAAQGEPPDIELHLAHTPLAHIDIVQQVRTAGGTASAGYVLLSLRTELLMDNIRPHLSKARYIEIRQSSGPNREVTVVNDGDATLAKSAVTTAIPHTAWTLAAAPVPTTSRFPARTLLIYLVAPTAAIALLIAAVAWLQRRAARLVRADLKTLARMFQDIREETVRVDYPLELIEFRKIFRYLRDSGRRLMEQQQQLKDMGLIDHLSQLPNRRAFENRLAELFAQTGVGGPSSLLIVDLDHFKSVNDQFGHDAGDALIINFSHALRQQVRHSDFVARLGGDEFCVIFSYTGLATAQVLAERLRQQLPRELALNRGQHHALRWTGGLSEMETDDTRADEVLWRADQALIRAKQSGRNQTQSYAPGTGPRQAALPLHD